MTEFANIIDAEVPMYERGKLAELGVMVPPHTLHDYSPSGTSVIIAAIKIRLESAIRIWTWRGCDSISVTYHCAPLYAALKVERERLKERHLEAAE